MVRSILTYIIIAASLLVTFSSQAEEYSREQILMSVVLSHLDEYHFKEMNYNNEFSQKVYDLYLKSLDARKRFLLQDDINELNVYHHELDDAVKVLDFEFYNRSVDIYKERQKTVERYFEDILAKPFDFEENETFELDPEKLDYAKNEKALKDRWRKVLKYSTLTRIFNYEEMEEHKGKSFDELEKLAREKVLKQNRDWFTRLNQQEADDDFAIYVNAVTQAIDPHTNYYPPAEKDNFDITMSGKLEGIGARLQQEGAYTKVTSIIPGSPSAKQGDLAAEDVILKVAQGSDEPVEVVDMPINDVVKLIRGKKGTEVRLTVKKLDGTTAVVPIIRDVVILEETFAKSAIVEEDGSRIGYIYLPSFYSDFDNRKGRDCFYDVKAELEKLQKEGIDGLVFDLRNNTGGYLYDVVKMAGLFIEDGPICQVKSKQGLPKLHKDSDEGIQYTGPLTVLVNTFSASASEIFAAAIQDYDRGVVIGSESTYGKGTVQRFFDLDKILVSKYDYLKPLGSIKMTIQKFYRIDGGSTQQKGVVPDIILPDQFSSIEVGERLKDNVMPWTEITPANYDSYANLNSDVNSLKLLSDRRIQNDATFKMIMEHAEWNKAQRDDTNQSLNYETLKAEEKEAKEMGDKYEEIVKEISTMKVSNPKSDQPIIDANEEKKQLNEEWLMKLNKDIYIWESINILQDFNL